jgi:hypothetical protein
MSTRIPVILLALALGACDPQQPQEVPPPPASPASPANPAPEPVTPAPSVPADSAVPDSTPTPARDPSSTPAAPAQPAPEAPSPTEPSPTPKPTARAAPSPAVESMAAARPSAKMSVAVDLRYQFDGAVTEGQPATLHLAAIPRVTGNNFQVQVKSAPGLEISRGTLSMQKVDAAGIYRQQVSVLRRATAPDSVRVQVTMEMPEGTAFGFFTIPLDGGRDGNTAQKSDSVKPR